MVPNKSARTGNQNRRLISHGNRSLNISLRRLRLTILGIDAN